MFNYHQKRLERRTKMFMFIFEVILMPIACVLAAVIFVLGGFWAIGHTLLFVFYHPFMFLKYTGMFFLFCLSVLVAFGIYIDRPKSLKEFLILIKNG